MKIRSAVILAAAAVLGLSACNAGSGEAAAPAAPTGQVEGVRDGRTTLSVGQTLHISLPSNGTTGYQWRIEGQSIEVLSPSAPFGQEITDAHAPGMVGVGGHTVWTFRAAGPGTVTLNFAYARSWEQTAPAETATYTIVVR
ncbi:protease inhibitor I42 family protein [Brevundimonas sp.]|uniref:protease inhibitor I42 family protein n=1 Tax=Brevundimonas sp. TaxID=1871086 RepID=UPI003D10D1B3